jgi:hypothetical protein
MRLLLPLATLFLIAAAPEPTQEAPPAAPPAAQSITVSQFLARYAAIKGEKDKAKAVSEVTGLMSGMGDSMRRYKAEIDAQTKAGARPRACPRKGSKDRFTLDTLAEEFLRLPAAEREGPFEPAFFAFLDKRHPCPMA